VGPIWHNGRNNEAALLSSCYKCSLALAVRHDIRTIAFPNISTGIYGYPKHDAARVAIETVTGFLNGNDSIAGVHFTCFDEENYLIYGEILSSFSF
jgi:O-acetyl-ADP-ribose deacetylase (regulator of RNase III)